MPMTSYFRPIVRTGSPRPADSILLAETEYWIGEAEEIKLGENTRLVSINDDFASFGKSSIFFA